MATIPAVVSDLAREKWPKMIGGLETFYELSYFKVGEGGWVDPGSGKETRTPDPTLTDLDCIENPGRYPIQGRANFQKSFGGGDLTFVAPTTIRLRCFLDFGDFNDDGYGNYPEMWEIAIFDADDNMVAYGTFPIQVKNPAIQIENFVNIVF